MSYWRDDRDLLEELYPSCTSFTRFHPQYPEGLIQSIPCGMLYLIAFWSASAVARFKFCCYCLEDSVEWDRFEFHVIDIDTLKPSDPFTDHQRLGGDGDVMGIRAGKLVGSLGREWTDEHFEELIRDITRSA